MLFGLEPSDALRVFLWISRLWPIVAPLIFLLVLRDRIRKPLVFFVFGALACVGIHTIAGQFFISLSPTLSSHRSTACGCVAEASRRFKKVENAEAMVWKLLTVAEKSWRKLNAPNLLKAVYDGNRFKDGVAVKVGAEAKRIAA